MYKFIKSYKKLKNDFDTFKKDVEHATSKTQVWDLRALFNVSLVYSHSKLLMNIYRKKAEKIQNAKMEVIR